MEINEWFCHMATSIHKLQMENHGAKKEIYTRVCIYLSRSSRAEYDTRSILKWSEAGLNSEFSL